MCRASPYEVFAEVYDQPDHAVVSHAFHRRLRALLNRLDGGATVIDLGCGTGVLTGLLAAHGFQVVGIDQSWRMLEIARRRCSPFGPQVSFAQRALGDELPVQDAALAVACGDVVNHLRSASCLRSTFEGVKRSLRTGALLAFDALEKFCFEAYWNKRTYLLEGEGGDLVMQCSWNGRKKVGTARMISYARLRPNLWRRRETTLREYLHSRRQIRRALGEAGFEKVHATAWSPWPDQHLEPHKDRTFWVAS